MHHDAHLKKLCRLHDTPLYVYNAAQIKAAVAQIRASFPGFSLIYSAKTNPFGPILQLLNELGVGIDAASANEVLAAAKAGHTDIYYSAPGKKAADIQKCWGISHIIADSLNEIKLISDMAQAEGRRIEIGIRINLPNPAAAENQLEVMGGESSKFGINWDVLEAQAHVLCKNESLRINGLHVYSGSQLLDAGLVTKNINAVTQVAQAMQKYFTLKYINYGGGFGVPYEARERPLDLQAVASGIETPSGVCLNLELGRFLVARAGVLACTVTDIKQSGGITYVITDGGMNAFFRPKFTGQHHRVRVPGKDASSDTATVRLVGNSCTPLDVTYEAVQMPMPQIGDIITFGNAGAYGYSMSLLDFISFDKPKQVLEDY